MTESFLHDPACVEVRTGEDGTWITLKTKDGGGYTFQPINLNDLEGCIAKWCQERREEVPK